jgi:hypothetical protein
MTIDNMNLSMNDALKLLGQETLCNIKCRCGKEFKPVEPKNYSGNDMRLCPECKTKERIENDEIQYSTAGRHRAAFESDPFRGNKY